MRFDTPVLLYGAGREARSTRAFLAQETPGLKVYVTVDSGDADVPDTEIILPAGLSQAIAEKRFGLIVKSPGVSLYKPVFDEARKAGIPVTSNLNLWAAFFRKGRTVIAITGTKGKSTTATLTHAMLAKSGCDAGLAGNVGVPPLEIAGKHDIVVLELSSYQTADMDFTPDFVGITNLTPEHIDWHGSVERYYRDKLNILDRDGGMRVALSPAAHATPEVERAIHHDTGRILPLDPIEHDAVTAQAGKSALKGAHNHDNARLAARLALVAGANLDGVLAAIADFKPLPHRLEEHVFGGMRIVNDSISTTPEATKAALAAYEGHRIALIAGGHDRQQDYSGLAANIARSGVQLVLCLPVTGERLAAALASTVPGIEVLHAENLEQAVAIAASKRDRFDTLILSPGAPSYNQFKNFEERGHAFVAHCRAEFGD